MAASRYDRVITERADPRTRALDRLSPLQIARVMNRADREAVRAAGRAAPSIARAVDLILRALGGGGRLFFVGAGTSGRLGVLEAAECPPTFGILTSQVQAVMAGGRRAIFRSKEGAEDDARDGARQMRRRLRAGDVVAGISASGTARFVLGALAEARRRRAATILVTCNPRIGRRVAQVVIVLETGPEVLAGSTRLKAGTATKLALNTLTTATFARMGHILGNRMIMVQPRSAKLRARAVGLVGHFGQVSRREAERLLAETRGSTLVAITMARSKVTLRGHRRPPRA
ncbi:MAG: N-acetylmuramic acid 6-phosphate etherase [Candidatus Rokubacteria bacterium]|nr:N-acetylmuramic acid 6-phosphate etherase [Candidatus Rokubacteria bacterium]